MPGQVPRRTLIALFAVLYFLPFPPSSQAQAPPPPMGWETYYALGGQFTEQSILAEAQVLVSSGLARAGYNMIQLQWGWAWSRTSSGMFVGPDSQWPQGIGSLIKQLHHMGLKVAAYTDGGPSGCYEAGIGSYGHYAADIKQLRGLGFNALEVDFCGGGEDHKNPRVLFGEIDKLMPRGMLLEVANLWTRGQVPKTILPGCSSGQNTRTCTVKPVSISKRPFPPYNESVLTNYQWAAKFRGPVSWRTQTDIAYPGGYPDFKWRDVVRNLDADAKHPSAASPGHWNDPDALGIGWGLKGQQGRAQLSMWAILDAPMILGADLRHLTRSEIAEITNPHLLRIVKDPRGLQGRLVSKRVWVRKLSKGQEAVALFNPGHTKVSAPVPAGHWLNVWTGRSQRGGREVVLAPTSADLYVGQP